VLPLRDANSTARRPVVTLGLVGLIAAVFGYELFLEVTEGSLGVEELFRSFGVIPADVTASATEGTLVATTASTLITYQFLHAGFLHAAGNLLYLWIFGNNVEDRLGPLGFLVFYIWAGVVAALVQVIVDPTSDIPLVGASGAISGVLGAYLVLFPRARVVSLVFLVFFFQIIAVPAVVLLSFWFVLQLMSGLASLAAPSDVAAGGVAFFAHIGGFLAGVAVGLAARSIGAVSRRRRARVG
jgi:membrane associated rhomboid family serine protease